MTVESTLETLGEQTTDEELVRRIVAGDAALFEILMRRHNQRIYRAVRGVLGNDDEAEDVMQQAYLNAYEHLAQFEGQARFTTWMTRIAVNEALGRLRKRERFFDRGAEIIMELAEAKTPNPEEEAKNAELREVLEREVAALPAAFRTILVMRDVEGLSTAEAAECLEVSEDVVKTRLHRARAMLRERLDRRAGVTLASIYAFGARRCDRVVQAVMARIS